MQFEGQGSLSYGHFHSSRMISSALSPKPKKPRLTKTARKAGPRPRKSPQSHGLAHPRERMRTLQRLSPRVPLPALESV